MIAALILALMGLAWLADLSMAAATNQSSLIPYVENFPALPTPLAIRDWKQTALDYHQLAFNPRATGLYLPLLYEYTANTTAGFSGPAFGLPSYVGNARGSGEALTALGAVLGGTLAGIDMTAIGGKDRVAQCEVFYCLVKGHGLVLNNVNSQGSGSAWYDLFPSTLLVQISARYPGRASLENKMRAVAESWFAALPVLSNNWEHTGFSFSTMAPVDKAWREPDMAIGIAWLEYMAHARFGDAKYLAAAEMCLDQMSGRSANPFYETLGLFGPVLAARMNAEHGGTYPTEQYLNWIFSPGSKARPGWGCESGRWGGYDAYGLIGSTTDTSGYAFSMNTYAAAGLIAPVVRYEPRYARLLGRWLLHVAANANLFYPDTLATNRQSSAAWVQQTGVRSISYEGVRNRSVTTPYATGDAAEPVQDLNPYGAWGSGYMAALYETSNVPGILEVNCLATDTFPPPAYPTFLYYNPHAIAKTVRVYAGSNGLHLYDAVSGSFVKTNAAGNTDVIIPPDAALLLVQCPAAGALAQAGTRLSLGGVVIDYWNGQRDTDGDGLPDWWESRYFGRSTEADANAWAANGLSIQQCYWLGLDPTNPDSTFKAQASRQSQSGFPVITWNAIGGQNYVVEYVDQLNPGGGSFAAAWAFAQTNIPAGTPSMASFVDDYSLTGGPPGVHGRCYRIRWTGLNGESPVVLRNR